MELIRTKPIGHSSAKRPVSLYALRSLLLVLLLVVSSVLLSGCKPNEQNIADAKTLVEKANRNIEQSQYADAMKKFEEARRLDDANQDIYVGIADIYMIKNRNGDARSALLTGLPKARKTAQMCEYLGEISIESGETEDAVTYLKRAISEDKTRYKSAYLLGLTYVRQGNTETAREVLDVPEAGGEWYARAALLTAITYWEDIETAKPLLTAVVDGEFEESVLRVVETYLEDIERVDALEEDAPAVYRDVILAHGALEAGYGSIVVDKLLSYTEDEKEYWDLMLYIGKAYVLEDDTENAQQYLENAVLLNPADPFGPWYLARVYKDAGMDTEMQKMYQRSIALTTGEDRILVRNEYAKVLFELRQYEEFDSQITLLKQENPEDSSLYTLQYVESLIERELYDEALTELSGLDDTVLPDAEKGEYSWLKAKILFMQGDRENAVAWAEDAQSIIPDEPKYSLLLGQIYFETGKEDKAKTALERSIDLDLSGEVSAEAVKVLDRI